VLKPTKPQKKKTYEEAKNLRLKGFSYAEIAKICLISKSTVANWFSREEFSITVTKNNQKRAYKENSKKIKLINKAKKASKTAHRQEIMRSAEVEFKHYKNSPLFITGLTIYELAGDKKQINSIRLSSKNSEAHRLFIKFTEDFLGIDKKQINFHLSLYKNQDEAKLMKYWSQKINLSLGRFYKNQFFSRERQSQTLHFGVGNTIIGNTTAKGKLMLWLKLFQKEF